jgi:hypothetical protein
MRSLSSGEVRFGKGRPTYKARDDSTTDMSDVEGGSPTCDRRRIGLTMTTARARLKGVQTGTIRRERRGEQEKEGRTDLRS